jgi:hypothetical protein
MALVLKQPRRVYSRMPRRLPLIDQYPLYALSFDGSSGYVKAPNLDLNRLTVMAWIKTPNPNKNYQMIITKGDGTFTSPWEFRFYGTTGKISLCATIGGTFGEWAVTDVALRANVWYYVAATYDGSYVRTYINGEKHGESAASGDIYAKTIETMVGARKPTAPEFFFIGLIALPCVYNRALSQAEIQRNMYNPLSPVRDGLVLWLPFLEGSGTAVKDYSGLGNNGALNGGVSWVELAKYEIPAGAML